VIVFVRDLDDVSDRYWPWLSEEAELLAMAIERQE
jgi:hypothetical protein